MFGKIGRWWGSNPIKKRQEEIDIIVVDEENAIFGECKWRNEATDTGILNDLMDESEIFKQYRNKYYIIISFSQNQDLQKIWRRQQLK